VPSRAFESCLGAERSGQAGLSHHRWLIDIDGHRIRFLPKYHMIHTHWRFHLPASHLKRLSSEDAVQWLWWEERFDFEEVTIHGVPAQEAELQRFVHLLRPRPAWMYEMDRVVKQASALPRRAASWIARRSRRKRAA
jgi:hypothetical protein